MIIGCLHVHDRVPAPVGAEDVERDAVGEVAAVDSDGAITSGDRLPSRSIPTARFRAFPSA